MSLFRLTIVLMLAACASTPRPQPAAVPENLRVPDGQPFLLRATARGAQIYTCKPKAAEPAEFEWVSGRSLIKPTRRQCATHRQDISGYSGRYVARLCRQWIGA